MDVVCHLIILIHVDYMQAEMNDRGADRGSTRMLNIPGQPLGMK